MGVNNGYDIGVNGRDLILKTSGKIYVKVSDKFYELDFKKEQITDSTQSEIKQSRVTQSNKQSGTVQSDVVLLDTLSNESYPGDNKIVINNDTLYITKGGSYKKINNSVVPVTGTTEFENKQQSESVLVKASDGIWSFGENAQSFEIEFIDDPTTTWSDYWFFNTTRDYFFEDVYGEINDELFWENIFFNVTEEDSNTWTTKTKSEIESVQLSEVYKNNETLTISDFKRLYDCFCYSEELYNELISEYIGPYAQLSIEKWTPLFSPKTKIKINGCETIVTAAIGDTVIVKFKNDNVTLNSENIQKLDGSIILYNRDGVSFLDVLNSDLTVYNNKTQNEDDVKVRVGNLDTLAEHSGIGAFFNNNVTIKNEPFILNSNGSGNIGDAFVWDVNGSLSGTLIEQVNSSINDLRNICEALALKITELEKTNATLEQQYKTLLEKVEKLEEI